MRYVCAVVAVALALTATPAQASDVGKLLHEDTFDGAAGTQPAGWDVMHWPATVNGELQYYTNRPQNVDLDGAGNLRLRTYTETYRERAYTSGRIHSQAVFRTGTYVSARIRVPAGQGLWPAFWLLGPNWPNGGEADIVEVLNDATTSYHSIHAGPNHWRARSRVTTPRPLRAGGTSTP